MNTSTLTAPPGLKGLVVADTTIGSVRGNEGFFHYREFDATDIASTRSFEAIAHLLLVGHLPDQREEGDFAAKLGAARDVSGELLQVAHRLADMGHSPLAVLRSLLSIGVDPIPSLDQAPEARRDAVIAAVGMTPTLVAAVHRQRNGLPSLQPDPELSHATDYVRMLSGSIPSAALSTAVERYLSLTADHGFNASTFTSRVITSTGADIGGVLSGAVAALSGPLHGGAPSRVLDMITAIGDPTNTETWAQTQLEAANKLMGFGHAVYRAEDPRGELLRDTAAQIGGELVERAIEIEGRLLAFLEKWKPEAKIVTNVEYYAAVVLHLAGIPQDMFTATFATSRIVGWGAHILEQAADNKIMRPSARYVGPAPA